MMEYHTKIIGIAYLKEDGSFGCCPGFYGSTSLPPLLSVAASDASHP